VRELCLSLVRSTVESPPLLLSSRGNDPLETERVAKQLDCLEILLFTLKASSSLSLGNRFGYHFIVRHSFDSSFFCLAGWTGDPFISCREFNKNDLCNVNSCGANAQCQPGIIKPIDSGSLNEVIMLKLGVDRRTGEDKPVCTCPGGYVGDPLVSCNRGRLY